jgi:two-component system, response regulator PdtaR
MIVEDEILIGMMLAKKIRSFGYHVGKVVTSGEEAVALANISPPDVVIMDISLAGSMDGIETAEKLRANKLIPIIFFTGYQDMALLKRAESHNPVAIVDKLGSVSELHDAIVKALS